MATIDRPKTRRVRAGVLALVSSLALLAAACRSSEYDPADVPKDAALVVTSGGAVHLDGRELDLDVAADASYLARWMRDWRARNQDAVFIIWMPGQTPTAEVVRFFQMLEAAGIGNWKIWKGREVR